MAVTNKKIEVPFIKLDGAKSIKEAQDVLDKYSAIISIDQVNWKEKYPYKPEVRAQIAHSNHYIWILANIKENHIKAYALKDYENVWEDSCFEFFVQFPNHKKYINFETNCIGVSTADLRTGRDDSTPISKEDLKKFVRISSLEQKLTDIYDSNTLQEWKLLLGIPKNVLMKYFNTNKEPFPSELRANFYKCGDLTNIPHFLSWNPVNTPECNFHLPEFFGNLILEDSEH